MTEVISGMLYCTVLYCGLVFGLWFVVVQNDAAKLESSESSASSNSAASLHFSFSFLHF